MPVKNDYTIPFFIISLLFTIAVPALAFNIIDEHKARIVSQEKIVDDFNQRNREIHSKMDKNYLEILAKLECLNSELHKINKGVIKIETKLQYYK